MHIVGSPADPRRNFTQRNWVPSYVLAQPHLRRAPHPPIDHFDFRLASERTSVQSLTEPVAFPGVFEDEDRRVIDCQKTRQFVPGSVFLVKQVFVF